MALYKVESLDDDGLVIWHEAIEVRPGRGPRGPRGSFGPPALLVKYLSERGGVFDISHYEPMALTFQGLKIARSAWLGRYAFSNGEVRKIDPHD